MGIDHGSGDMGTEGAVTERSFGVDRGIWAGLARRARLLAGPAIALTLGACAFGVEGHEEETIDDRTEAMWSLAPQTNRIRIATFNTALVSPMFNLTANEFMALDIPARAKQIAKAINEDRDQYDVIAFNEVFDEDGRQVLVDALGHDYPYYVKKLHGTYSGMEEDSGLMLFSRFPFVPLNVSGKDQVVEASWGYGDKYVAFKLFSGGSWWPGNSVFQGGEDALAQKGAALVRVKHPTGHVYNIVFTHLQADGDEIHQQIREYELEEIESLLVRHIDPDVYVNDETQDTIVMGDLNIRGDIAEDYPPSTVESPTAQMLDESEYGRTVWGRLDDLPFYDVWRTTSPKDPGHTYDKFGSIKRYDYMLMHGGYQYGPYKYGDQVKSTSSLPIRPNLACPTWVRTGLKDTTSDHIGILAELGPRGEQCSPSRAQSLDALIEKSPDGSVLQSGLLATAGTSQWFRLEDPGTFSIGIANELGNVTGGHIAFDVFKEHDLSAPLDAYRDEDPKVVEVLDCNRGGPCKIQTNMFVTPSDPVYIRVHSPSGRYRGKYKLFVKRHDCASKEWACGLRPGEEAFDPKPPKGVNYEGWFIIDTDAPWSKQPQDVNLYVENPSRQYLSIKLLDDHGASASGFKPVTTRFDHRHRFATEKALRRYLVVRRLNNYARFKVRWTTNLTWFIGSTPPYPGAHATKLVCTDETGYDYTGKDEILLRATPDGRSDLAVESKFKQMDTDSVRSFVWPPIPFVGSLVIDAWELEEGDDEHGSFTIKPLDPEVPDALLRDAAFTVDDGDYAVQYNLTHSLND